MSDYPGLNRLLSQLATTKRRTKGNNNKWTHVASLSNVPCSKPYPLDPEIRNRMSLATPHELLSVYAEALDIKEGDLITINGVEYPIRSCANWPLADTRFLRLIIEDLKS